jgi:WD40 repeat protein
MKLGANYLGYKLNRMISQPSGYRFFPDPHRKEQVTHIACGNENSSVALWSESKTPSRVLAGDLLLSSPLLIYSHSLSGHSATVNAVHFSPTHRGLLATVSDDHTVRLWTAPSLPTASPMPSPQTIVVLKSQLEVSERLRFFHETMLYGEGGL